MKGCPLRWAAFFWCARQAQVLGGSSPLYARKGEVLAEGKVKLVRGCLIITGGCWAWVSLFVTELVAMGISVRH